MRYLASTLAVSSLLAGCSILEDEVARGYAQSESLRPVTFTTADIRLVTQRNREGSPTPIICTEPSPDVAKALSAAVAASGQGGKGEGGSAGGASAEAVLALAGRSTALLGLRDGLYRACEAYANGALGADAYALVLSRYGQLMTTLFLGQDITGAAGTSAGGSIQSPPVTVNASGGTSVTAGQPSNPPAGAAPAAGPPTASGTDTSAVALTRMNEDYLNLGYNPNALIIACINYKDPTRLSTAADGVREENQYLRDFCPKLFDVKTLGELEAAAERLVKNKVLAPPVSPEAVMQAAANKAAAANKPAAAKTPTPSTAKAPTPAQIMLAQEKLKADGENPTEPPNGELDAPTRTAVTAYQTKNKDTLKLKVTGALDTATLKALGVP